MKPSAHLSLAYTAGLMAVSALLYTVPADAQTLTNAFGGLSESSDEPIDIASDTLTIYADDYALFSGNVKAVQGTTTLRARELKVHYLGGDKGDGAGSKGEQAAAQGAERPAPGTSTPTSGASATKPVTDGGEVPAAAPKPAATEAESVDDPIDIQSDWLLVHDKEKYAHFRGNVRVVRGDTKLRSKELTVNFDGGESLSVAAESNDGGAPAAQITKIEARGDVRAFLAPKGSKSSKPVKEPTEPSPRAVAAQAPRSSDGKPELPRAGDARHGAADEIAQNATPNSSEPKPPASAGNAPAPSQDSGPAENGNRQITKLEATGQVVITSEKDETSTSDWAIYDMPSELVTIGGNVVLTQNETVLKGDRLVIDLRTGESRFENTGTAATGGRRIRALFMPKEDGAKPRAKPNKPAGGGGSAVESFQAPETPPVDDTEPLPLVPEFR